MRKKENSERKWCRGTTGFKFLFSSSRRHRCSRMIDRYHSFTGVTCSLQLSVNHDHELVLIQRKRESVVPCMWTEKIITLMIRKRVISYEGERERGRKREPFFGSLRVLSFRECEFSPSLCPRKIVSLSYYSREMFQATGIISIYTELSYIALISHIIILGRRIWKWAKISFKIPERNPFFPINTRLKRVF